MDENDKIKTLKDLLAKYRRGECTLEEEKAVDRWLDGLDQDLGVNTYVNPPKDLASTIYDNILTDSQEVKNPGRKSRLIIWSTTIAATVLLGLAFWFHTTNHTITSQTAALPVNYDNGDVLPGKSFATLAYPKGEVIELPNPDLRQYAKNENQTLKINTPVASTYSVQLEDGTQVWLNAASTITYPEKFDENERRVKLTGEAYFKVAHDENRPFFIEANDATIEVLGTTFNVNAYDKSVLTTLVEGSVKVQSAGQNNIIKPGEQALCRDEKIHISRSDEQKNLAWQRGEFYFDGNNLTEICEQISRWYDVKFVGIERLSPNSSFKGSIARNQNLSQTLNILSIATNGSFQIKTGIVIAQPI